MKHKLQTLLKHKLQWLLLLLTLITTSQGVWGYTVYFDNTNTGWSNVYIYFYSDNYWNDNGSGSSGIVSGPNAMTKVSGNIWSYENSNNYTRVAFTKDSQSGYGNFWSTEAAYSDGTNFNVTGSLSSSTPLFTPSTTKTTKNSNVPYYSGAWSAYTPVEPYTVYFDNTNTGWSNVYIYFYSDNYWNDNGSGSNGIASGPNAMTNVSGNIWSYENNGGYTRVAFTKDSQSGYGNFWQTEAAYSDGTNFNVTGSLSSSTPLFTPGTTTETKNSNVPYYSGAWSAYSSCTSPTSQTVKANNTESALTVCSGTSVTITTTASQSGFTYELYEGNTKKEEKAGGSALTFTALTPSTTQTYTVKAYETGSTCSPESVGSVTVTVNAIPSISATTPGSNCGPGTVTLGATASAGSVKWYSTSTGGSKISTGTSYTTESLSTTTTYYVDATSNGCTTATRTPVTATIKTVPTILSTTPGSRCGTGTVTLGATASAGTVNWYSTETGGSSLAEGTDYTTGSLSTTTIYYVDATSDGCTTASREEVVATVNANPSAPAISSYDESVCSGSAPTFTFNSSSGLTYQMYVSSSTSGSSVAGDGSSKTLTAGSITSATTFNLRATDANGCYASSADAAVSITPDMALTSITLTPSTICTGGESTVTANELVLGGGSVAYTSSATSKANVAKVSDSEATVSGVAVGSSTITATLSGGCGSTVTKTANISVSEGPAKFTLTAAGGTTICSAGGKLRLSGSESGFSYQLYKNGSAYGSPVAGTGSAIEFDVFESGDYVCRAYLTSSPSCYTVMTGEVTLHISLTPSLIPATPTVTSYTPVTITSINTDILTWEISGEGNTAYLYDKTSNTVKVKASAAGSPYTITATTSGGCSQTATLTVNADVEVCN